MNGRVLIHPLEDVVKDKDHATSDSLKPSLLSLPRRVRTQIYLYPLLDWYPHRKFDDQRTVTVNMLPSESHITPSVKELGIPIFAVCRQLYHETRPVFFFRQFLRF